MANGHDANFDRLCAAIDGFFVRHGHWPTRVLLRRISFEDLRNSIFTRASWVKLEQRIKLVATEGVSFIAQDDVGLQYNYGEEGFPKTEPQLSASKWLGVVPDRDESGASNLEVLFETLFDHQASPWWKDLDGEVRQRKPPGRYLEQTIDEVMDDDYRTLPRHQLFFTPEKLSCMDGRFGSIGIEEKVIHLDFEGIRDGAICRSLVWVLGNPMALTERVQALGLCVVKEGAPPLSTELASSLFPVIHAVRSVGVEVVFVNGKDGRHWPKQPGGVEPPPDWLAARPPAITELPSFTREDVARVDELDALRLTEKLFTSSKRCWTAAPDDEGIGYAEWGNHWQMLDVGLLLRARGLRAVKVKYTGKKLTAAGHGVEARVQRAMRNEFGVVLDWGVPKLE